LLVHAITAIVAIVSLFKSNFNLNGIQAVVPGIAVLAAALTQASYGHSRAVVKAAAQNSAAQAASPQAVTQTVGSAGMSNADAAPNGVTQHLSAISAPLPAIILTGFQLVKN
jgi:hypothetical protein